MARNGLITAGSCRWLIQMCLALWTTLWLPLVSAKNNNPLGNLFMMNMKDRRGRGDEEDDDAPVCVSPKALETAEKTIEQITKYKEALENEKNLLQQQTKQLQKTHDDYRQDSERRLESLTQANESAQKIAKVQEEFAERVSKLQQQADVDLERTKELLRQKETETRDLEKLHQQQLRDLQQTHEQSLKDKEQEWKEGTVESESAHKTEIDRVRVEFDEKSRVLAEEKAMLKGENRALQANIEKLEVKYEGFLKDQDAALEAFLAENLDSAAEVKAGEIKVQLEQELRSLKESSSQTIDSLTTELNELKASSETLIEQLRSDYQTLEQSSATKMEELTKSYNDLKVKSSRALEKADQASKAALEELQTESTNELHRTINELTESHKAALGELQSRLENVETDRKGLVKTIKQNAAELSSLEEKLKEATKDAKYWEAQYDRRSYFNLTQVATDAKKVTEQTAVQASETVVKATEPVLKKSRDLYDSHVIPSAVKSKELYDYHVKPTVDYATQASMPVYNDYVAPQVEVAKKSAYTVQEQVALTARSAFVGMSKQVETGCPAALSSLRDLEKKTGLSMPQTLIDTTRYTCQNADESVQTALKVIAVIFALLFRRTLFRLCKRIVWIALRLVLLIITLPFRLTLWWKGVLFNRGSHETANGGGAYEAGGTGGTPPPKPRR